MNDILFSALHILIILAGAIFTRYLVPYIKSKLDTQKLSHLMILVKNAVFAAEQIYTGTGNATNKKAYVMDIIKKSASQLCLPMTDAQLETLLESFVQELNQGKKGTV